MKRILFCVLCLSPVFGGPVLHAQQPDSHVSAPAQSKATAGPVAPRIDTDKEAAIRRLIQLTGGDRITSDLAAQVKMPLRPALENLVPPGKYRAEFIDVLLEKFGSRFAKEIVWPTIVSVYAQRFSEEELKQLIAFYESPLGRKLSSVLPDIDAASQKLDEQTEKLMDECMEQVLAEHPDLKQAMEKATQGGHE